MKKTLLSAAIIIFALVSGSPAMATSNTPFEPTNATWNATGEANGVMTVTPDGVEVNYGNIIQSRMLNLIDFFGCTLAQNPDYLIKNYATQSSVSYPYSRTSLYCGSSDKSGYLHIKAAHESDWQSRINSYGGGSAWDDLMDFATAQVLSKPRAVVEGISNKSCFWAPVKIYDSRTGYQIDYFEPTVIVSGNNKLVITSYPTTRNNC
jgi:hypothetical protein